jgi:hypothetical protein
MQLKIVQIISYISFINTCLIWYSNINHTYDNKSENFMNIFNFFSSLNEYFMSQCLMPYFLIESATKQYMASLW